jgi:hypothetical protein
MLRRSCTLLFLDIRLWQSIPLRLIIPPWLRLVPSRSLLAKPELNHAPHRLHQPFSISAAIARWISEAPLKALDLLLVKQVFDKSVQASSQATFLSASQTATRKIPRPSILFLMECLTKNGVGPLTMKWRMKSSVLRRSRRRALQKVHSSWPPASWPQ